MPAPDTLPPEISKAPPATPEPVAGANILPVIPTATLPTSEPIPDPVSPPEPLPALAGAFSALDYWQTSDPSPALKAFKKTCGIWKLRPDDKWLDPSLSKFGRYADWRKACQAATNTHASHNNAVRFFQSHFEPVAIGTKTGLLTAYYVPEIPVRRLASLEFSEPILAKPTDPEKLALPRARISVTTSKVLAYGRPIDVFFMQVQGSGKIKFPDGTIYRAAYDGHNGHPYISIGSVLIKRGDLAKDKVDKQSIEDWMAQAGYMRAKQLMAENPRYIFFKTEHVTLGEGPKGAAGLALTAMGSLAVEPKYYPYGALIWVEGKFPVRAGDYIGTETGHLLVAQDVGVAIKGEKRGDVFFGSGAVAGGKAGVMKHRAKWTLFLPVALAQKLSPVS